MSIEKIIKGLEYIMGIYFPESLEGRPKERHRRVLLDAIDLLRTYSGSGETGWISVKDKINPPPKAEKVMAYLKLRHGDLCETAYYMGEDGWYYTGVEAPHHGVVTHWMPLPEPPKED